MLLSETGVNYALYCVFITALFLGVDGISSSLQDSAGNKVLRVLLDTTCHAALSGAVWFAATRILREDVINTCNQTAGGKGVFNSWLSWMANNYDLILSCFCGSAVDVDHFIAARSLSLTAATHLQNRPWGHCFLSGLVVCGFAGAVANRLQSCSYHTRYVTNFKSFRTGRCRYCVDMYITGLVLSAYVVHLLRDSVRRGLWLISFPKITSSSSFDSVYFQLLQQQYWVLTTPPIPVFAVLLIYMIGPILIQRVRIKYIHVAGFPDARAVSEVDFKSNV